MHELCKKLYPDKIQLKIDLQFNSSLEKYRVFSIYRLTIDEFTCATVHSNSRPLLSFQSEMCGWKILSGYMYAFC